MHAMNVYPGRTYNTTTTTELLSVHVPSPTSTIRTESFISRKRFFVRYHAIQQQEQGQSQPGVPEGTVRTMQRSQTNGKQGKIWPLVSNSTSARERLNLLNVERRYGDLYEKSLS